MTGHTVFFSYRFLTDVKYGYGDAIHCNYINKMQIDTPFNKDVSLYFEDINDFKFLTDSSGVIGYRAKQMEILIQVVDNSSFNSLNDVIADSKEWRIYPVTDQIKFYTAGDDILAVNLIQTIFKISLNRYTEADYYDLGYIDYSTPFINGSTLNFGDEEIFFGNVKTHIEAIAHCTEIDIHLPLNEFNITTNKTWDGLSTLMISEVGIYNSDKELVAIAKLNYPVSKDSSIARTLVFGIDF